MIADTVQHQELTLSSRLHVDRSTALRRPYTFVVMAMLDPDARRASSILQMPTDIFPEIDIPVISVVWNYGGLSPEEMEKRIVTTLASRMLARRSTTSSTSKSSR